MRCNKAPENQYEGHPIVIKTILFEDEETKCKLAECKPNNECKDQFKPYIEITFNAFQPVDHKKHNTRTDKVCTQYKTQ